MRFRLQPELFTQQCSYGTKTDKRHRCVLFYFSTVWLLIAACPEPVWANRLFISPVSSQQLSLSALFSLNKEAVFLLRFVLLCLSLCRGRDLLLALRVRGAGHSRGILQQELRRAAAGDAPRADAA